MTANVWEDVEEEKSSCAVGGSAHLCNYCENQCGDSSEPYNVHTTIALLGISCHTGHHCRSQGSQVAKTVDYIVPSSLNKQHIVIL